MTANNEVAKQPQGNENYNITQNAEGKFVRKAIYKPFSSVTPVTKEEKIELMNLIDGEGEETKGMKEHVGDRIEIADVIFNPYTSVDEDTGEIDEGVLTFIIGQDGETYVTSSKSVYHRLQTAFRIFGEPHYTPEEALIVEIVEKKGSRFKYVDLAVRG